MISFEKLNYFVFKFAFKDNQLEMSKYLINKYYTKIHSEYICISL